MNAFDAECERRDDQIVAAWRAFRATLGVPQITDLALEYQLACEAESAVGEHACTGYHCECGAVDGSTAPATTVASEWHDAECRVYLVAEQAALDEQRAGRAQWSRMVTLMAALSTAGVEAGLLSA